MFDRVKKKVFGRPTDRSKKFWQNAAKQNIEKTMWYICDGYDKETFDKKPTGFVNLLKNYDLENKIVMDLACGIGRTCKWISPQVKEYVGVDFIPEMIKKAKSYNSDFKNAKFFVNDGETLQIFEDETFDIVFCELAIQHMNKPVQESYIKEVFRVLKENGLFFVQIPKMEFYKDENYARTKEETNKILQQFSLDIVDDSEAYYTIKAEKK